MILGEVDRCVHGIGRPFRGHGDSILENLGHSICNLPYECRESILISDCSLLLVLTVRPDCLYQYKKYTVGPTVGGARRYSTVYLHEKTQKIYDSFDSSIIRLETRRGGATAAQLWTIVSRRRSAAKTPGGKRPDTPTPNQVVS
jgi:hypothetical protein